MSTSLARAVGVLAIAVACAPCAGGAAGPASAIVFSADRVPAITGEVYRLDSDGALLDLSKSPFQDTAPVVSPDGKLVAFVSNRGGPGAVYVSSIDGTGLQRLDTPPVPPGLEQTTPELAWAPNSKLLALIEGSDAGTTLSVVGPGRPSVVLAHGYTDLPSWSPDSRLVTVATGTGFSSYRSSGGLAWHVRATDAFFRGWSERGLFLTVLHDSVRVYDDRGRLRLRFPGRSAAWSLDGKRIVSAFAGRVEVRTSGGRLRFRKAIRGLAHRRTGFAWLDRTRIVLSVLGRPLGIDISTGKTFRTTLRAFLPRSPDGRSVVDVVKQGDAFAVRVRPVEGPGSMLYGTVPGCFDDGGPHAALQSLQFVPGRDSLVLQSYCAEPPLALYSVAPGGTVTKLTSGLKYYVTPQRSPDGTRLAYTRLDYTGESCKGCPGSIWVANADGSNPQLLVSPDASVGQTVERPSWSPDGTTILFTLSGSSNPGELFVVPAAGGKARDLGIAGYEAAWGPARIAWVDLGTIPTSLWTARPDGSDRRKVADVGDYPPAKPAWSADGRLAYVAGQNVIAIVTGTTTQRVHLPFERIASLAWSPDGSRWAVSAQAAGTASYDIYTVRTDGSDPQRLTTDMDAASPSWR